MYFIKGMPEGSYHTEMHLNRKWQNEIIGSASLDVIKLEANKRRQYEIASITMEQSEVKEISKHRKSPHGTYLQAIVRKINF